MIIVCISFVAGIVCLLVGFRIGQLSLPNTPSLPRPKLDRLEIEAVLKAVVDTGDIEPFVDKLMMMEPAQLALAPVVNTVNMQVVQPVPAPVGERCMYPNGLGRGGECGTKAVVRAVHISFDGLNLFTRNLCKLHLEAVEADNRIRAKEKIVE